MSSKTVRFIVEIPARIDRALRAEATGQKHSRKAHLAFILEERFGEQRNGQAARPAESSARPARSGQAISSGGNHQARR
jgi:hypothetical protein